MTGNGSGPNGSGPNGRLASDSFFKPNFTLEQIRTFLAVAAREHITRAAKVLELSQPAVTQQVQLLERALGVRLLEKVGRNVRLTDAGVEIAGACLLVMRSLEHLESVARSARDLELGTLAVGASQVAACYYLSPALAAFTAKHQGIEVEVTVTSTPQTCEQVAEGRLECGLVDAPLPKTNLIHARVATDEVLLVAHPRHPLAGQSRISPKQIKDMLFLVWDPGSSTEAIASELLGSVYSRLRKLQLASLEAARQALIRGVGFAAVPRVAVADDLRRGVLARIPIASRARPIFAVRRPGPGGLPLEAFWSMLLGTCPPAPDRRHAAQPNGAPVVAQARRPAPAPRARG